MPFCHIASPSLSGLPLRVGLPLYIHTLETNDSTRLRSTNVTEHPTTPKALILSGHSIVPFICTALSQSFHECLRFYSAPVVYRGGIETIGFPDDGASAFSAIKSWEQHLSPRVVMSPSFTVAVHASAAVSTPPAALCPQIVGASSSRRSAWRKHPLHFPCGHCRA